MIHQAITAIQQELSADFTPEQIRKVVEVLKKYLPGMTGEETKEETLENHEMLPLFISAKRVEGYSGPLNQDRF